MALSMPPTTSTEQAVKTPAVVAAIRKRILKHAPLTSKQQPQRKWPPAVGFVCAQQVGRCIQVPGGGSFNVTNTKRSCADEPTSCPPLKRGEWLALAHAYTFDSASKMLTFDSTTRVKKSTINTQLLKREDYLEMAKGRRVELMAPPSKPVKVDQYSYVLLRCVNPSC
eukprot:COSAG01_NODE_9606_length_2393_cov_1.788579_2_plen_168_part_00